ncbi:MAG TPA: ATP-binding protein [Bacillota bacterium]|nr:ATP-binding protein [Bacillota bacterium]
MNPPANEPDLPWANAPYSIKRHGVTITNCDAEPVQTPGCIQAHGALLVLRPADLTILQASENSADHLGHPPERLLNQPVTVVLGAEGTARLRDLLRREPVERNPLYAFSLPARPGRGALDLSVHTLDGVAVLEFEPTGRGGSSPSPDYYSLVKSTVARLQTARTLRGFCQTVAEEVRALTGLDRVMVYRFHADAHGEVFAESKREDLPAWLGLHYPADDIPKPAREIFKRIWIRPLPDAAGPLMELVPLVNPDTGQPLTMTYCALRGASVMYTEYLRNMGVAASLTMSLLPEGELWGLIACHHYRPTYFPYQVRTACEFLAQVVALQLKAAEEREHLAYRLHLEEVHQRLVAVAAQEGGLAAMTDSQPNLLDGMAAGGAALFHRDRWWRIGQTPNEPQLEALAAWLMARPEFTAATSPVYATDSLASDYPPGGEFAAIASGVLAVPLSRAVRNLMLWFRPETIQTVKWAGNPHDKPTVLGPHGPRLTPRRSFDLFVESVRQRAVPWSSMEIAAAVRLRLLVMELVVSRAEQLALLNAELTRSNEELDAFAYVASHDLKEPLRGIHRYAHHLLAHATALEPENRYRLEGLTRLTARMDSLLDSLLHFSRVGRTRLELETVDLNEVVAEALEIVGAARPEVPCEVRVPRPLPCVRGDRVRVREIFTNLLSNALKYSDKPRKQVEVGSLAPAETADQHHVPSEAAGQTIFYVRDNGIGIDERHYQHIFEMFRRLHGRTEYGGGVGAGLTIVKKLVERHGGRIWLTSAPGQGSTFFFTLPGGESAPPAV